jgi:hypothetical protein
VKTDLKHSVESVTEYCLHGLDNISHLPEREPRGSVAILTFAVILAIYYAVPDWFAIGPRWPIPILISLLLIGAIVTHKQRMTGWNDLLGTGLTKVVLLYLLWGIVQLIAALLSGQALDDGQRRYLLLSAALLWCSNIVVFSLLYWRWDAGGPNQRDLRRNTKTGHREGAFLFPQMQLNKELTEMGEKEWHPEYIDYLFLAFNTSTALSPTDTAVLAGWAKKLMMLQSMIALIALALLAGRAVNIL